MKQKHARNSSLELLRIICILLIIGHHYCAHGGYAPFSAGTLSPGAVFVQSLGMFGRLSCSIFILITGFCMAEHTAEGHYKRIVPVAAEMIFYSVVIWLGFVLLGGRPFTVTEALNAFVPFFHGNWFLVYYLVFYPFIPFVNLFIHSMSKEVYRRLLLVVFVIWCLAPTFTVNAWVFSNVDLFLVMYLTGAYIKLHVHGKTAYNNRWNLAVALLSALVLVLSAGALDAIGAWLHNDALIANARYFREVNMLPAVVMAISLFLYFSNIEFHSGAVDRIAGSVLGIYLIHDNELMRPLIWRQLWPNTDYLSAPYLHALIKILAVFLICLAIDLLRRATVEKLFLRGFQKLSVAWDKKHASRVAG